MDPTLNFQFYCESCSRCQTVLDQFRQGLLVNIRELIASFNEFADEMEVQPLSPGGMSADNSVKNAKINQTVVKATALLRLYTALRGIAGLKCVLKIYGKSQLFFCSRHFFL